MPSSAPLPKFDNDTTEWMQRVVPRCHIGRAAKQNMAPIMWYNSGSFNNGRSNACYAFKAFGCWRIYGTEGALWNFGSAGNSYSGSGSWFRTNSAPNIL